MLCVRVKCFVLWLLFGHIFCVVCACKSFVLWLLFGHIFCVVCACKEFCLVVVVRPYLQQITMMLFPTYSNNCCIYSHIRPNIKENAINTEFVTNNFSIGFVWHGIIQVITAS